MPRPLRTARRLAPPAALLACLLLAAWPSARAQEVDEAALDLARRALVPNPVERKPVLAEVAARGTPDMAAALIQVLRFIRYDGNIIATLEQITGAKAGDSWHDWMLWQEAHPEVEPFAGFDAFKADAMALVDENFRQFLQPGVAHEIRLEEVAWGGVVKDGIPALVNPKLVEPVQAAYLTPDELVFGVEIAGDTRAYPLRILDWHEMFNDVIGGVPVALAYCTLCASGILYETQVEGREAPFVFGSSGFLYRSNKLMYDRETNSLWNQFTGRPVVGPLTGSGIELKVRPVVITTWEHWYARHPETRVLSLDTGYERDYTPGKPYGGYFASPDMMFPALLADDTHGAKLYVFALRDGAHEKAWPLRDFADTPVINDTVEDLALVLIGDAGTRSVRAYRSGGRRFEPVENEPDRLTFEGATWEVTEAALVGPEGETLERLPGHIAYWFAWAGFHEE